jgi:hypothetical protein
MDPGIAGSGSLGAKWRHASALTMQDLCKLLGI